METFETKVDVAGDPLRGTHHASGPCLVPGSGVRVTIPFSGESGLLKLTTGHRIGRSPRGEVTARPKYGLPGTVTLVEDQPADMPIEELSKRMESNLECFRFWARASKDEVEAFNRGLPSDVQPFIKARRARLEAQKGVAKLLGIPLKRKYAPALEPIRLERALVRPLPNAPKASSEPEYGISDLDYEHILKVIRHEARTFETTPATYRKLDEEELRNVLLAHLNGHFEGGATGETFRRAGKTDIKIEFQNRAAFVGECKVWRGPAELKSAVDQLLGYLTWRDSKAAMVVFNKHVASFSDLLAKAPQVFERHTNFKRRVSSGLGEWRFVMASQEDPARLLTVQLFVANLYAG